MKRIMNERCETIKAFTHIGFPTNDVIILYVCITTLKSLFSPFVIVWIIRLSMPLKKAISVAAVLIIQPGKAMY